MASKIPSEVVFIQSVSTKGAGHCITLSKDVYEFLDPLEGERFQISVRRVPMTERE